MQCAIEGSDFGAAACEQAASTLCGGGVAVIPTDTVYGLAAHPGFPGAVARLYSIKERAAAKPIALLAASIEAVRAFGAEMPPAAEALAAAHWPGPLTLVLPCGGGFEGFRVPGLEWTRRLLAACGGVLRVTSANMAGGRDAISAEDALKDVGISADLVVDGGLSPGGTASTVLRVSHDGAIAVLRPGPLADRYMVYWRSRWKIES